jgi:hypothetical protein
MAATPSIASSPSAAVHAGSSRQFRRTVSALRAANVHVMTCGYTSSAKAEPNASVV